MIKEIIKDMSEFYNKKIIFNTSSKPVNKNTKSFKLSEEKIGEELYITSIRCEEFDDFIEVNKINVITVNNEEFLKLNKR